MISSDNGVHARSNCSGDTWDERPLPAAHRSSGFINISVFGQSLGQQLLQTNLLNAMTPSTATTHITTHQASNKLLWTGGWDSTFQLLQLLLIHRQPVTPYYLIDEGRGSVAAEIVAMKQIKQRIFNDFPETEGLLSPTQYFAVGDIPENTTITQAFKNIIKRHYIGSQYEWLARFCTSQSIFDLQLCIHRDDKAHSVIENLVHAVDMRGQQVHCINSANGRCDEQTLFGFFTFPIFEISKTSMHSIAEMNGWGGIMAMTWFCHNPRFGMKPCGACNPCRYTIEEGLGARVPLSSRIFAFFSSPLRAGARRL